MSRLIPQVSLAARPVPQTSPVALATFPAVGRLRFARAANWGCSTTASAAGCRWCDFPLSHWEKGRGWRLECRTWDHLRPILTLTTLAKVQIRLVAKGIAQWEPLPKQS